MALSTPVIAEGTLSIPKNKGVQTIAVGTPEWFAWLDAATVFRYCEDGATFTAQKRARKGRYYWYAYTKRAGQLQCIYLGRSHDLTSERLHFVMNQLYPIADSLIVNYTAEHYGSRSAKAVMARQQCAALYTEDTSGQQHLNLVKVNEQLQQLGARLRSERGRAIAVGQHALDVSYALLLAYEQLRDIQARDLAILRALLRDAQKRIWEYEAMLQRRGSGEVF